MITEAKSIYEPSAVVSPREPMTLRYIMSGGQSDLYGDGQFMVKVHRFTGLGLLGPVVASAQWQGEALRALGGLMAPMVRLPQAIFRVPAVTKAPVADVPLITYRGRAIVRRWWPREDFLDQQMYRATPTEALRLMQLLLVGLRHLRARGFHLVDFIMSNFVVTPTGVCLVDAGLLIPVKHLWKPTQALTVHFFTQWMVKDYLRVLEQVCQRAPEDPGVAGLREFMTNWPQCIKDWRYGRGITPESAVPVEIQAELAHFATALQA